MPNGPNPMPSRLILIKVAYDDEADVWYVDHSSLAGLSAEAPTVDDLIKRLPGMIIDLIEENGFDGDPGEVALEVVASHAQRIPLHEAA